MAKYKVGDEVWVNLDDLAIKCTIEYVQQEEDNVLYWIDEPIGAGLDEYDLFDSLEEITSSTQTLEEYRDDTCAYLQCDNNYPRKEEGVDWVNMLRHKANITEQVEEVTYRLVIGWPHVITIILGWLVGSAIVVRLFS